MRKREKTRPYTGVHDSDDPAVLHSDEGYRGIWRVEEELGFASLSPSTSGINTYVQCHGEGEDHNGWLGQQTGGVAVK